MDKDTSSKKDDSIPSKMITTTWEELIGGREWYNITVYRHIKMPVMIHRKGCFLTLKEELEHAREKPPHHDWYCMVVGTIEEAEKTAQEAVEKTGRPGWKKAGCCNGSPCVDYASVKNMRPQFRTPGYDFRISFKHNSKTK